VSEWAAAQDAAAHTFVEALDDTIEITGADGHHLQRVRRIRVGEHLTAADGFGSWRRYEVEELAPGALRLGARSARCVEPEIIPRVALAVALTKAGALDTVVARCTELGVARVVPVRTRRCVARWDAKQADRAVGRLRVIAREAASQSRRARVPEISAVAELDDLATHPGLVVADRAGESPAALFRRFGQKMQEDAGLDPSDRLDPNAPRRSDGASEPREWLILVGPEGGLEPAELEALHEVPRLSLGPHVLRAETAPIAAVAVMVDQGRVVWTEL
jgi:16S rRNA (uracil1498-N3)-methyltransferase